MSNCSSLYTTVAAVIILVLVVWTAISIWAVIIMRRSE